MFLEPLPPAKARMMRILEGNERRRLKRSREMLSPPLMAMLLLFGTSCMIVVWTTKACGTTWIYAKCAEWLPESVYLSLPDYAMWSWLIAVCLTMQCGACVLDYLEDLLHVTPVEGAKRHQTRLKTANALGERVHRYYCGLRNKPTHFEVVVAQLEAETKIQFATWRHRCAQRDFFLALRRQRITGATAQSLLCDLYDGATEEGQLPGG
jgi:hypothetical protein